MLWCLGDHNGDFRIGQVKITPLHCRALTTIAAGKVSNRNMEGLSIFETGERRTGVIQPPAPAKAHVQLRASAIRWWELAYSRCLFLFFACVHVRDWEGIRPPIVRHGENSSSIQMIADSCHGTPTCWVRCHWLRGSWRDPCCSSIKIEAVDWLIYELRIKYRDLIELGSVIRLEWVLPL